MLLYASVQDNPAPNYGRFVDDRRKINLAQSKTARHAARRFQFANARSGRYATFGARFFELRWKNSAWLATAETIAGWNGFEIKNAGSGRSPARERSG